MSGNPDDGKKIKPISVDDDDNKEAKPSVFDRIRRATAILESQSLEQEVNDLTIDEEDEEAQLKRAIDLSMDSPPSSAASSASVSSAPPMDRRSQLLAMMAGSTMQQPDPPLSLPPAAASSQQLSGTKRRSNDVLPEVKLEPGAPPSVQMTESERRRRELLERNQRNRVALERRLNAARPTRGRVIRSANTRGGNTRGGPERPTVRQDPMGNSDAWRGASWDLRFMRRYDNWYQATHADPAYLDIRSVMQDPNNPQEYIFEAMVPYFNEELGASIDAILPSRTGVEIDLYTLENITRDIAIEKNAIETYNRSEGLWRFSLPEDFQFVDANEILTFCREAWDRHLESDAFTLGKEPHQFKGSFVYSPPRLSTLKTGYERTSNHCMFNALGISMGMGATVGRDEFVLACRKSCIPFLPTGSRHDDYETTFADDQTQREMSNFSAMGGQMVFRILSTLLKRMIVLIDLRSNLISYTVSSVDGVRFTERPLYIVYRPDHYNALYFYSYMHPRIPFYPHHFEEARNR